MKIFFIDNGGGGFADTVDVEAKTTVSEFFKEQMEKGEDPKNYLIRVNRDIVSADDVLKEGDRVTVTPVNIEGAHLQ